MSASQKTLSLDWPHLSDSLRDGLMHSLMFSCGMRHENSNDLKPTLQEPTLLVLHHDLWYEQTTRIWGPEITLELNHIRCCCWHVELWEFHEAKSRTFETGGGFGGNCHAVTKHLMCSIEHLVSAWENLSPESRIISMQHLLFDWVVALGPWSILWNNTIPLVKQNLA